MCFLKADLLPVNFDPETAEIRLLIVSMSMSMSMSIVDLYSA